ncbi:hypothetical protein IFM89_033701, partial [Coptis chinensis]
MGGGERHPKPSVFKMYSKRDDENAPTNTNLGENLGLFMDLQTFGDRVLRKLCFSHVVHSIQRMNMKHKNDAKNRALQNIIFSMLQNKDEGKTKRALVVLCDLHHRRVWFDERTANAISTACFHSSSR